MYYSKLERSLYQRCRDYGGSKDSLDALRYRQFTSPKYVPLERMPPTSWACYYHCLRVHIQVFTWRSLQSLLCPDEFGFKLDNGALMPIITEKHHQKCSGKSVVPASQPTAFAHHVPASRIGCRAACTANVEDNVRTAALFPMDATNESVRFAQHGNENEFHSNN